MEHTRQRDELVFMGTCGAVEMILVVVERLRKLWKNLIPFDEELEEIEVDRLVE